MQYHCVASCNHELLPEKPRTYLIVTTYESSVSLVLMSSDSKQCEFRGSTTIQCEDPVQTAVLPVNLVDFFLRHYGVRVDAIFLQDALAEESVQNIRTAVNKFHSVSLMEIVRIHGLQARCRPRLSSRTEAVVDKAMKVWLTDWKAIVIDLEKDHEYRKRT